MAYIENVEGFDKVVEAIKKQSRVVDDAKAMGEAVQLLREIVAFDPYDQWDVEKSCHFCDSHFGQEHMPDCLYAKAQAFIAALDVK